MQTKVKYKISTLVLKYIANLVIVGGSSFAEKVEQLQTICGQHPNNFESRVLNNQIILEKFTAMFVM